MKKILTLMAIAICLLACDAKKATINDLEKLTNRIEQQQDYWKEADWDDAAQHLSDIRQDLEKYELTDEERYHVGELEGRCLAYMAKHYSQEVNEELRQAGEELKGALQEFKNVMGEGW